MKRHQINCYILLELKEILTNVNLQMILYITVIAHEICIMHVHIV